MKDFKDASDGIRTRVSFFRRTDLPGTPYISIPPEYINTRLRASPHQCNIKSILTYKPIKASQDRVVCLERPSFTWEAYRVTEVAPFHVIIQLGCYRWIIWSGDTNTLSTSRLPQMRTLCRPLDSNQEPPDEKSGALTTSTGEKPVFARRRLELDQRVFHVGLEPTTLSS